MCVCSIILSYYLSVSCLELCCLLHLISFLFFLTSLILWFLTNLYCLLCLLGIERLLLLLGEKPSSSSPSEGAACERVQQKAAVTLARLSRDPDIAQTAIQLKGTAEFQFSDSIQLYCVSNDKCMKAERNKVLKNIS